MGETFLKPFVKCFVLAGGRPALFSQACTDWPTQKHVMKKVSRHSTEPEFNFQKIA